MNDQSKNVFVSYSHADAPLVAPVVSLLRANRSLVFQDRDRILPGKKWRDEIAKAIAESHMVVVFWCGHACQSPEVSNEWKAAIAQEKDLLPLLLDATPLPLELGDYQWIDFRGVVGATHSTVVPSDVPHAPAPAEDFCEEEPGQRDEAEAKRRAEEEAKPRAEEEYKPNAPAPAEEPRGLGRRFLTWSAAAVMTTVLLFYLANVGRLTPTQDYPYPATPSAETFHFSEILLWLGVILAVTVCVVWLVRRFFKRRKIHHIASELEKEILRRTASS